MSEEEVQETQEISDEQLQVLLTEMKSKENMVLAVVAGLVSSLVGAGIWAAVTIATQYQIGWMAVGIGFLVGFSVRYLGKGISAPFGIIGAAFALLGCLLGNFLTIAGFIGIEEGIGIFEVLEFLDYTQVPNIMISTFEPMDVLFYAIAVYEAYKFGFQQQTLDPQGVLSS